MLESKLSELGNVGVALMMLEASFTLLHTQTLRHTHTHTIANILSHLVPSADAAVAVHQDTDRDP